MPKSEKKEQNQEIGYIKKQEITKEMEESYIDYAMSVIVSRALPDVRDGLKPVHRRILYAAGEMGLMHAAKFRKSATVVGDTMGKFHPHGDAAIYDSLVRMAQTFSLRYPLIKSQGNFGCFTKDTKVKLCDGRALNFGELIKEQEKGKRHWTFSFNAETQKIEIAEIKKPRLTKKNEKIIEITLDNKEKIRCTLDHRFMLRSGKYREAQKLESGDSLMPLYTKLSDGKKDKNLKEYKMVCQPIKNEWEFVHRLSDKWNLKNLVYKKSAGKIRHHLDFNKLNNNPDNILRIQWKDHWEYHKKIASERHKNDPEYVKKIAEGRRKFIENNREILSARRKEMNKILWQDSNFRKRHSKRIKELWQDQEYREYMAEASSKNLKRLWQRKDFQELLSKLKSQEMKKRWQDKGYRIAMSKHMKKLSLEIWSNPKHREYISKLMREKYREPEMNKKISERSKKLWQDPEYRNQYSKDHFSKMAKKLWEDPKAKEFHREKAIKQWQNSGFRERAVEAARAQGKKRMQENPNLMKELAAKARISLCENWQNPSYKKKVIKSKVLRYVHSLLDQYSEVNLTTYEEKRTNNGVPRIENALNYFENFQEIIEQASKYNHKVKAVKILRKREDVYDLTIESLHNFALAAGVFVHNSIDGDPAAAARYTECKLSKAGEEMLKDIKKDTVDFVDNYDGSRKEPKVLPAPAPQLLLNGALGIAVGMATSIPPHNLNEVCDAAIFLVDNPQADTEDLFKYIKGPDFPTGGAIFNQKEIITAYSQGKGPILMRGKAEVAEDDKKGRSQIVITEIPYSVNKSTLVQHFAKLVQEKKINGIKDIRDESDKDGMRIVFDLQKDAFPQKILNQLYKFSDLQKTFHLNMLALVDGIQPKVLSLAEVLTYYLAHKKEVVVRRVKFDLKKAEERAHILEGLHKCLSNIDAVIKIIKGSKNREEAQQNLMKKFKLTQIQADAILETKLHALAKLERDKVEEELKEKQKEIKGYLAILKSQQKIKNIMKEELAQAKESFGDARRTKVYVQKIGEIAEEDLIPQEETIITLTKGGYIKRINPNTYKIQKRGGKGIMGMKTVGDDIVEYFLSANTHDSLFFFTDSGKVFQTPVYEIPEGSRVAKGRGLLNFLEISADEKVLSVFPLSKEDKAKTKYLVIGTKKGIIKKTDLKEFENVRRSGLIAINLKKGDLLQGVGKVNEGDEIMLVTKKGQSIKFKEKDARKMGRAAAGVRGIRLKKDDEVIAMDVIQRESDEQKHLLVVMKNGYGKRTDVKQYKLQGRGGSGIRTAVVNAKTGDVVVAKVLVDEEDLIVISRNGQVIRSSIELIPKLGRSTQGVRIMRLGEGDNVASGTCV